MFLSAEAIVSGKIVHILNNILALRMISPGQHNIKNA